MQPYKNNNQQLDTDYLIIGAGATGLAFADEMLNSSKSARIIMVDRRAKPGGHWNDAYDFVKLHQPSAYYGVNSEQLGQDKWGLASKFQILAYYERIIKKLEATGRFHFFPLCNYKGDGQFSSLISSDLQYQITYKKLVDATYLNVKIPLNTPPNYQIDKDLPLVPVNGLTTLKKAYQNYMIIGAGKTGIDAIHYLLDLGVHPEQLIWVISNDCWWLNRREVAPFNVADGLLAQMKAIKTEKTPADIFLALEKEDRMLRLDPKVLPTKYRCATINKAELAQLRRVKNTIRKGRIINIGQEKIAFTKGHITTPPHTLYIDCSARGLSHSHTRPIFQGQTITLQPITVCQPTFGSAAIAKIELAFEENSVKNERFQAVATCENTVDLISRLALSLSNIDWLMTRFPLWAMRCRLSMTSHISIKERIRMVLGITKWGRRDQQTIDFLFKKAEGLLEM